MTGKKTRRVSNHSSHAETNVIRLTFCGGTRTKHQSEPEALSRPVASYDCCAIKSTHLNNVSNNMSSPTSFSNPDELRRAVQESYGHRVKQQGSSCCGTKKKACCSKPLVPSADTNRAATKMGYTEQDIADAPDDSNLGLGCGAPLLEAAVAQGETVLDLGSGAGFDAFLAANAVGPTGHVIGVDMTEEMIETAKRNAAGRMKRAEGKILAPVDFRRGYIEELPVESNSIDVIISNCTINLSTDKDAVFREAYRVLKNHGRVCVSDIVLTERLPLQIQSSLTAYMGCIAGAWLVDDYVGSMKKAGFKNITIKTKQAFDVLACDDPIIKDAMDGLDETTDIQRVKQTIVSATVLAFKSEKSSKLS